MLTIHPYDLPDQTLLNDQTSPYRTLVWQPLLPCVVLGNSNQPQDALFSEAVIQDEIPVYKRPTGGQSVILTPDMLVVSILHQQTRQLSSKRYFEIFDYAIMRALVSCGIGPLEMKGISDIVLNGKKIAGTALYRNPRQVFFHAVINVAESTRRMERYLKFPIRVPDYRAGRSHREFVTSIVGEGFQQSLAFLRQALILELLLPPVELAAK
jgi:lipoate-protein ligase A